MRVVQINAVYGHGSTGTIVQDIEHECVKSGIDCYVASPDKNVINARRNFLIGSFFDHKLHALLSRIGGKQAYFSHRATKKMLRYLDEVKPDVVHLHNLHSNYINLKKLLNYLANNDIRIIITLHDCWFYTGGCTHYTHVNCNKWKRSCGNCPQRYEEFPALLYDASSEILKDRKSLFGAIKRLNVVGVSQWITDEGKELVFKNAKCLTIYNGIDTAFFHPVDGDFRKKHNLEGKFLILAPANKWFLPINKETLRFISQTLLDNDMVMIFIGNGVKKDLLNGNMINLGYVSSKEELRDIYSSVDVMVNCTREESLSLLNLEVQACGTPVVTYSNTGVKETVDGKCGYSVENGNPVMLLERISQIKREGKSAYSSSCVEWIKNNFDKDKNYKKYIDLYESIP